ncbi:MAG: class I SAM-dependent methyltransferase [Bacilli bacterium]|nr:class I SAM-dependent methyltransferase [Bacilli bacterium]
MEHYFTNNENLKSEIKELSYSYDNYVFSFLSDNGVFSKERVDYGSRFLLETYLKNHSSIPNSFLDVGCGYGLIGIVLSKVLDTNGTMIDVNKRAVHLTKRNIDLNKVNCDALVSNVYEDINNKFDLIITNPPIRAGKKILLDILDGSKDYLTQNGECWFVMRKDHGVKTMIKILENDFKCQIIDKSKGFYVVMMKIK